MAETEDRDSKTLEPTERKIRDALEKGNVPFAREAVVLSSLVAVIVLMAVTIRSYASGAFFALSSLLDGANWTLATPADVKSLLAGVSQEIGVFVLSALAVVAIAAFCGAATQGAPRIAGERIRPQWSRVSPRQGLRRIFGMRGQVEFLKSLVKLLLFALVMAIVIWLEVGGLIGIMGAEPGLLPEFMLASSVRLVAAVAGATVLIVLVDLVWSRFTWRRDLWMSHKEMKDEHKEQEGDPAVKARLRSLSLDRARRRMMASVPKATLVVANPTHYAVALRYDRGDAGAPVVVAKGRDLIALKIRELAERHGVPVIEDKALARSLFAAVEIDRMIPPEFYRVVAELICIVAAGGGARALAQGRAVR